MASHDVWRLETLEKWWWLVSSHVFHRMTRVESQSMTWDRVIFTKSRNKPMFSHKKITSLAWVMINIFMFWLCLLVVLWYILSIKWSAFPLLGNLFLDWEFQHILMKNPGIWEIQGFEKSRHFLGKLHFCDKTGKSCGHTLPSDEKITRYHLMWKSGCDLLSMPGKRSSVQLHQCHIIFSLLEKRYRSTRNYHH